MLDAIDWAASAPNPAADDGECDFRTDCHMLGCGEALTGTARIGRRCAFERKEGLGWQMFEGEWEGEGSSLDCGKLQDWQDSGRAKFRQTVNSSVSGLLRKYTVVVGR